MSVWNWLVVIIPTMVIVGIAFYCRRYVRDVVDFLSAGRVARRYVLGVASMEEALGVLVIVQQMERQYQTGFAMTFWEMMLLPVSLILSLTGFCIYRFRETKAMTMGQFLEMRYNRPLRVFASVLKTMADIMSEIILPALAARFFIYFFDLPQQFSVCGFEVSTYVAIMLLTLTLAITIIWAGGSVALLVTDCIQGLCCYPMFLIITAFVLIKFNWSEEIVPVMFDRAPGESFLNPMDIEHLRNFNVFMLLTFLVSRILNRGVWLGAGYSSSAQSAHEQKMASLLGTWRAGFSTLMCVLLGVSLIVMMNHQDFSDIAHQTRQQLSLKVASEVMPEAGLEREYAAGIQRIGEQKQRIGIDPPLSQLRNLDTPYMAVADHVLEGVEDGNLHIQKFRTLYRQLLFPVALRNLLPEWMHGLFILMMVMVMISTDDSRIFNIAGSIAQDLVLPFRSKPMKTVHQLWMIRGFSLLVGVLFFIGSLFMAQLDYIQLFVVIVNTVWVGGAGAVVCFGLYSRFGTTAGAFAALGSSAIFSVVSVLMQRNWADIVYPWLESVGMVDAVDAFLQTVSSPFNPFVVWKIDPVKFPINAYEIFFIAMMLSLVLYVIVSLLTYRRPFNLDRMLHRGKYNDTGRKVDVMFKWSPKTIIAKLIGISPEYTRGDRIIAYSVFIYSFVYRFLLAFLVVFIWDLFSPLSEVFWGRYFLITLLLVPATVGLVSTFWFFIGGVIDVRHLFIDLEARKRDITDDGRVQHKE